MYTLEARQQHTVKKNSISTKQNAPSIPDEILLRLPPKSVLRCRAVCRSWRRVTSDPKFLLDHHLRQPELPLVSSYRIPVPADQLCPSCLDAIHLPSALRRPIYRLPQLHGEIIASCDGLFVIHEYNCPYIYNPTTRQCAPAGISRLKREQFAGFYRHQPSGEYRFLYWKCANIWHEIYCLNYFYVLTVGSNKPRQISCSIAPMDEEIISGMGPRIIGSPVFLHGGLHMHWKKKHHDALGYNRILVFDTVAESFRQLRPPPLNPRNYTQLFAMDGMLAMSTCKEPLMSIDIFMLEDYDHEVWAFRCKIKLPMMEIGCLQLVSAEVVSEQGDILVSCFGWLLHCDNKGNLLSRFHYNDDLPAISRHRIKESLIQHAFFKR